MGRAAIADDPLRGSRRLLGRLGARRRADHLPGEAPTRVLVGGERDVETLRVAVATALGCEPARGLALRFGGLEIEPRANAHAASGDADRWPLAVELRPVEPVPHAAYVETTTAVLRGLWERGLPAVALCGFADELPRQGAPGRFTRRTV